MRNILLDLEYDGTDFYGSQFQVQGRTVQSELEQAVQQLIQQETRVTLAGRTDRGVHARGQRANFHTASDRTLQTFLRALNALLPDDLAVRRVQEVPQAFHARFDARRRTYRYTVYTAAVRSPLARRYAWHVAHSLDLSSMEEALAMLVGEHDFASFASASSDRQDGRRSTVRTVYQADCWNDPPWLYVEITANAFLRRMVRNIVGQLIEVARGRVDLDQFRAAWQARDRRLVGPPAPPQGLCLEHVKYTDRSR